MKTHTLEDMRAGFSDEPRDSQAVFRVALHALAHPGRVCALTAMPDGPAVGSSAAAALLLALLDADCQLWLSPRLAAAPSASWLRFHTGCQLVSDPAQADFAWVAEGDEMPRLAAFAQGSDIDPEDSTTLVLDLESVRAGEWWELSGPGIETTQTLRVRGLPSDFATQWQGNHATFPRGVDVFLASASEVVGLPRTVQMAAPELLED